MKKLVLLTSLLIASFSIGCTNYVVLFKPPAQLDPIPLKKSEREVTPNDKEVISWNLEKVGLDQKVMTDNPSLKGNVNVKIAILSTGVDYNHEDLIGQVLVNDAEITEASDIKPSVNYKDDDKDGLVDNIVGYDVVDGDGLAYDRHGAGTAVAGIIAAKANGYGVRGIMDKVALYPVRYINGNGQSDVPKLVRALEIALNAKSDVVFVQSLDLPMGGGLGDSEVSNAETAMLTNILKKYAETEIPIVVGAGESLQEFTETKLGKAVVQFKNVIVVTSTTKNDTLALLANRGNRTVEIAAPGDKVLTTMPDNKYEEVRGTAYAAAHVAAALGLAKAQFGEKLKLQEHIIPAISSPRANRPVDGIEFIVKSGSVLDIPKFLAAVGDKLK
ncbi:MAG: S8 family serine peptidase [Bdellovibrionales bacterium]|nr:S8 family serine peptidase [Bdellovibrionales bacterium]